jgi:hypothetical protein
MPKQELRAEVASLHQCILVLEERLSANASGATSVAASVSASTSAVSAVSSLSASAATATVMVPPRPATSSRNSGAHAHASSDHRPIRAICTRQGPTAFAPATTDDASLSLASLNTGPS